MKIEEAVEIYQHPNFIYENLCPYISSMMQIYADTLHHITTNTELQGQQIFSVTQQVNSLYTACHVIIPQRLGLYGIKHGMFACFHSVDISLAELETRSNGELADPPGYIWNLLWVIRQITGTTLVTAAAATKCLEFMKSKRNFTQTIAKPLLHDKQTWLFTKDYGMEQYNNV